MQSSYNLIKNSSALKSSKKNIQTNYISKNIDKDIEEEQQYSIEDEIRKNYEALGANIVKKAKIEAEEVIMRSKKIAEEIEKRAYEEGYNQGKLNGFEDGYNEGMAKVKVDTENEIKERIDTADEILNRANTEYKSYLRSKEQEIIKLAFDIASIIAKKELKVPEGINPLIENVLEEAKGEENIIIRCNNVHAKVIKDKINYYKQAYAIKGEIFILEDELMEPGNAIIDKGTGKAVIGIDVALEKLENALFK